MSENIFQGQGTPAPAQSNGAPATAPTASSDPFADLLGSIKNERGEPKYKDVNTALEALRHSQEFIPAVKAEKEELERRYTDAQKEIERLRAVEESVARLTSAQKQPENTTPAAIDPNVIADLVKNTLTQREQEQLKAANTKKVVDTIREKFGDEAEKVFYSKAAEVGLSVEQVNRLAAESPQAVLTMYGITTEQSNKAQPSVTPNSSTVNTSGYQQAPQSFLGRNDKSALLGATTEDLKAEQNAARGLVDELHSKGLSTYDLTDPKQYFKFFNKG